MGLLKSSSAFFRAENGSYVGEFRGLKLGRILPTRKTADDGSFKMVDEQKVLWQFALAKTDGSVVIDPATGEQAVVERMTSEKYQHEKATGNLILHALCASAGIVWDDSLIANDDRAEELVNRLAAAHAKALLIVGRVEGKDGYITSISPAISITAS